MPQVGGDPAFRVPNVHQQDRLRALQHLDLKFLVDREHDGIVGRVHVQPDHITYLGHHLRIRRQLKRLRDVVLQPNVRQMRPTMVWLMPVALAMVRVLQCVSPFGVVSIPFFGLESSPLRICHSC